MTKRMASEQQPRRVRGKLVVEPSAEELPSEKRAVKNISEAVQINDHDGRDRVAGTAARALDKKGSRGADPVPAQAPTKDRLSVSLGQHEYRSQLLDPGLAKIPATPDPLSQSAPGAFHEFPHGRRKEKKTSRWWKTCTAGSRGC